MKKKINYADLYTLRSDGLYMTYVKTKEGKRKALYDRNPEKLYNRVKEMEEHANDSYTFAEIANAWQEEHWKTTRDGTHVCYNPAFNRVVDAFGNTPAEDITSSDIYAYLSKLAAMDYATQTIKTEKSLINQIYNFAIVSPIYNTKVRFNPAAVCKLPPHTKKAVKRDAPSEDVVKLVRDSVNKPFGLYALFLISTGCRRGEALGVQWKDIDFKNKLIHINKGVNYESTAKIAEPKTDASIRDILLLPDLAAALKNVDGDHAPDDFIFHGQDPKKFLSESSFKRAWLRYCVDVGMYTAEDEKYTTPTGQRRTRTIYKSTFTSHMFRHGYATILFEAGVDVQTAKKLLGHSNIKTTIEIYTHLREKQETESLSKLEAAITSKMFQ